MEKNEIIKSINQYKERIIKYRKRNDEAKTLHCLQKLANLQIETQHLEKTGIGITVNSLCEVAGEIGDTSNSLVTKWKIIVCENIDKEEQLNQRSGEKRKDRSKNSSIKERSAIKRKHSDTEENQSSIKKPRMISDVPVKIKSESRNLKRNSSFEVIEENSKIIMPKPSLSEPKPKIIALEDVSLKEMLNKKRKATKIFSGCKTAVPKLSSLYQMCVEQVKKTLNTLTYTNGATFDALKPILECASSEQLFRLENYNAYLLENTNKIWKTHCKRNFPNMKRADMETWRDLYLRSVDEEEVKLKSVASSINSFYEKTTQPQIEFINIDSPVKSHSKMLSKPGSSSTNKSLTKIAKVVHSGLNKNAISSRTKSNSKPKMAPLMKKAIARMKRFW